VWVVRRVQKTAEGEDDTDDSEQEMWGTTGGRERGTSEVGESISGGYGVEDQKDDGLAGEGMRGLLDQ